MSAASRPSNGQQATLRDKLAKWKAGVSTKLDPLKERLVETTNKVIGIHDLMQEQRDDIRQLGEKLALINGHVLSPGHLSPNSDVDEPTMKLLQQLINAAADVDAFLKSLRPPAKRRHNFDESEQLTKLRKELDSIMSQLALSHTVGTGVRVEGIVVRIDRLERETAGSLSRQIPEDLLLAEIPPAPVVFHGRDDLVESIVEVICCSETCHIPLLGPGGIGKTSVAATVINNRRVKAKYGRRILFVSCEGLVTAEGILNALAACLHVSPGSDVRLAVLTCLLSQGCILLVLDNLETAWDSPDKVNVEQLLGKLAELSSLSLLVTMRGAVRPAGVDWAETCANPLTPLSLDAARQLWMSIARHHDDNLDRLLNRLDGIPLAITLLAHQGQLVSPTDLLEAYNSERTALVETDGGDRLTSLDVSIRLSINSHTMSQNANAAQLLSLLCLLPEGVTISELPKILPTLRGARKGVLALVAVALAVNVNGRLRVISPIRDFVMMHLPPGGITLGELRAHYMMLADEAEKFGTDQSRAAIGLLSTEFGNINSVLRHCWKDTYYRTHAEALRVATDQLSTFSYLTRFGDCLPLLEDAKKALECMDRHGEAATITLDIGKVLSLNHYMAALEILRDAKEKFKVIGDRLGVAQCTSRIGDTLRMLDRYDDALSNLEQAKAELETFGDRLGAAQCMQSIGDTLHLLDRYDDALSNLEQAKGEFETIGDRLSTAQCMQSIGDILRVLHRCDDALSNLEQAKAEFEIFSSRLGVAQCMQSIGDTQRTLNRYDDALSNLEQAKAEFETIGERLGAAQCMLSIGDTLRLLHRHSDALSNLEQAKTDFELIGDRFGIANCGRSLAYLAIDQGDSEHAKPLLRQSLAIYEEIGITRLTEQCRRVLEKLQSRTSPSHV
ncbi:TPR-like protein [Calocera viscosa TUFC12733]|uniref:TPR-like protein n=1 Tax=Calocera viscosa (strain TUFC12733) TaxID=1330018 RepID=A0A167M7X9_CALVF|nr:TPR-like protein [Calocera viscosa TUFC12733]